MFRVKTNICEHKNFLKSDFRWKPTSVNTIVLDLKPKFSCKSTSVNVYCIHRLLCTQIFPLVVYNEYLISDPKLISKCLPYPMTFLSWGSNTFLPLIWRLTCVFHFSIFFVTRFVGLSRWFLKVNPERYGSCGLYDLGTVHTLSQPN